MSEARGGGGGGLGTPQLMVQVQSHPAWSTDAHVTPAPSRPTTLPAHAASGGGGCSGGGGGSSGGGGGSSGGGGGSGPEAVCGGPSHVPDPRVAQVGASQRAPSGGASLPKEDHLLDAAMARDTSATCVPHAGPMQQPVEHRDVPSRGSSSETAALDSPRDSSSGEAGVQPPSLHRPAPSQGVSFPVPVTHGAAGGGDTAAFTWEPRGAGASGGGATPAAAAASASRPTPRAPMADAAATWAGLSQERSVRTSAGASTSGLHPSLHQLYGIPSVLMPRPMGGSASGGGSGQTQDHGWQVQCARGVMLGPGV